VSQDELDLCFMYKKIKAGGPRAKVPNKNQNIKRKSIDFTRLQKNRKVFSGHALKRSFY